MVRHHLGVEVDRVDAVAAGHAQQGFDLVGLNQMDAPGVDLRQVRPGCKTVLRAETLSAMQLLAQRALAAGSASEVRAL